MEMHCCTVGIIFEYKILKFNPITTIFPYFLIKRRKSPYSNLMQYLPGHFAKSYKNSFKISKQIVLNGIFNILTIDDMTPAENIVLSI